MTCNIDRNDRINRAVIGLLLVLCALFGASQFFYMIFGLVLIVQAYIGWCSIPFLKDFMSRFQKK